MNNIKIGNVELTEAEAMVLVGKYIITFRRVYVVEYGINSGVSGREVYYHQGILPLTKRGHFTTGDEAKVNELIGYKVFREV